MLRLTCWQHIPDNTVYELQCNNKRLDSVLKPEDETRPGKAFILLACLLLTPHRSARVAHRPATLFAKVLEEGKQFENANCYYGHSIASNCALCKVKGGAVPALMPQRPVAKPLQKINATQTDLECVTRKTPCAARMRPIASTLPAELSANPCHDSKFAREIACPCVLTKC